jgi:hypothetical protein
VDKCVYVLAHIYEYGENSEHEDVKHIGIFSTELKAKEVVERLKHLQGFCKYSEKNFVIKKFIVDENVG